MSRPDSTSPGRAGVPAGAPNRQTFALLVAGVVAFTVYGSLVPFAFRHREFPEAVDSFAWAMRNRPLPESRSDGLANVLLGVPLGFGLLGLVCVDRPGRRAWVAAAVLPACAAFAAAIEFAQLFVPARTCAGSDVLCQTVGAAVGMAGWLLFGQRLTGLARSAWGDSAAARLLVGYLLLLAFVQALPMDLTLSPADLYRKFRDGRVRVVPFGEFRGAPPAAAWERAGRLAQVVGLYVPAGLLAAWAVRREVKPRLVVGAAVALGCVMEAAQLVVQSRTPSATDVAMGACGALAGWWVGNRMKTPSPGTEASPLFRPLPGGRGEDTAEPQSNPEQVGSDLSPRGEVAGHSASVRRVRGLLLLVAFTLALLALAGWQPFDFRGPATAFDWLPGLPAEYGNDLFALEEAITKTVNFAPLGLVAGFLCRRKRAACFLAVGFGAAVSGLIEFGQRYLPGHVPGLTDVLLGGFGAFLGAWVAGRIESSGPACTRVGL